jgi:tellurite resistance protein TehA-like permease
MSVGPFAFTAAGMVQLGIVAEDIVKPGFLGAPNVVEILRVLGTFVGLWLWGLSWWFCLVSVGAFWKYLRPRSRLTFQMTWWSFVFPNTALVSGFFFFFLFGKAPV